MKNLSLLPALLFCLFISSCIVTEDEFGSSSSERTISVSMNEIVAFLSCEGDGTTGEGELFSTFSIYRTSETSNTPILLAESPLVLHKLGRGDILAVDNLNVEATVELFDGMTVSVLFETYEEDNGITIQIEHSFASSYTYNAQDDCWVANGFGTECNELIDNKLESRMRDGSCDILYKWSQTIE